MKYMKKKKTVNQNNNPVEKRHKIINMIVLNKNLYKNHPKRN